MEFATIFGFLGLLSIVALIVIYLIRPNYLQKFVSSTHVWKLSLKYRKRKVPIDKLRNIILIICQILIFTMSTFILTQPFIADAVSVEPPHAIVILDASASMRAKDSDGVTRFVRAIEGWTDSEGNKKEGIRDFGRNIIGGGDDASLQGKLTIILAGKTARTVASAIDTTAKLDAALESLLDDKNSSSVPTGIPNALTYGDADINGAMDMAEKLLTEQPWAEVVYFTSTEWEDPGKVKIVNVSTGELNCAILNVTTEFEENSYMFAIEVAVYGISAQQLVVNIVVNGANYEAVKFEASKSEIFYNGVPKLIIFETFGENDEVIYSFNDAHIFLEEYAGSGGIADALNEDNEFFVYGTTRDTLRIQYVSAARKAPQGSQQSYHNSFVDGALGALRTALAPRWDISWSKRIITSSSTASNAYAPGYDEFFGYTDLYIFEHEMPKALPLDGAVLLINPGGTGIKFASDYRPTVPDNLGITFGDTIDSSGMEDHRFYADNTAHPLLRKVDAQAVFAAYYTQILQYEGFERIMSVGADPVFLVKNTPQQKVAVLSFNLHLSNLPVLLDWSMLMMNLVDYLIPSTVTKFVFDVNEPIVFNSRGANLTIDGQNLSGVIYDDFPHEASMTIPGSYKLVQKIEGRDKPTEKYIFVRVPAKQSNFARVEGELSNPYTHIPAERLPLDLVIWFAVALVAFLFLERILNLKNADF